MDMLEQRIQQHFYDSADLLVQAADALARPVSDAAQALAGGLTAGAKVLVAGFGASHAHAQRLAAAFVERFERERPGLPALALSALPSAQAAQLRALAQPGDVLVLFALNVADETLVELAREARLKDMTTIAVLGREAGALAEVMTDTDVLILVPHEREARVHEFQLMIVHSLCDAVDLQLMGEEPPP